MELTHKDLQTAAKNINAVFEVKPQIKTITSRPNLEKAIKETLGGFVTKADSRVDLLDESTIKTYNTLVQPVTALSTPPPTSEPLETTNAGEGEEECPLFGKEFDATVPECTECSRAVECAPLTKKSSPKATPAPATVPAETSAVKKTKYGRMNAFCDVLSHNVGTVIPREEVVAKTDANYVVAGGSSNLRESAWIVRTSIRALVILGIVEETKEGYKYLGPPA